MRRFVFFVLDKFSFCYRFTPHVFAWPHDGEAASRWLFVLKRRRCSMSRVRDECMASTRTVDRKEPCGLNA
jgi:hypothetical protein